jgi:hypothetical protein
LITNSTNTTDGNKSRPIGKQKKKKAKPKSILKSGKYQGGSKKYGKGGKQKKSSQSKLI